VSGTPHVAVYNRHSAMNRPAACIAASVHCAVPAICPHGSSQRDPDDSQQSIRPFTGGLGSCARAVALASTLHEGASHVLLPSSRHDFC